MDAILYPFPEGLFHPRPRAGPHACSLSTSSLEDREAGQQRNRKSTPWSGWPLPCGTGPAHALPLSIPEQAGALSSEASSPQQSGVVTCPRARSEVAQSSAAPSLLTAPVPPLADAFSQLCTQLVLVVYTCGIHNELTVASPCPAQSRSSIIDVKETLGLNRIITSIPT